MFDKFGVPGATACIRGGEEHPGICGAAKFYPYCGGTLVTVEVRGLPESETGFFALHIHEGGDCRGRGFPNTGAHFNPTGADHPKHAGDLPPLLACNGSARMAVVTDRFRIRDIIGKTVIIHSGPDDFTTQPSGNAGSKIACGVIRRGCCGADRD